MNNFKPSKRFEDLDNQYSLVERVWDGTDSMRDAGQRFLPREPSENNANYKMRLNRATLFPAYRKTIKTAVGKAFAKPVSIKLPPALSYLEFDCDTTGTSLESFSKQLMEDAVNYGITYLLVDYPIVEANATLADEIALGANPYFVNIRPTSVLELHVGFIDGLAQLIYFRYQENVFEYDGTKQSAIDQVKEFISDDTGIHVNIYRKRDGAEYLHDTIKIQGIDVIPVIPVYGNKISPFYGSPTLYDLAQLNVTHWQMYSDYLNIVHSVQCPILVVKGARQNVNADGTKDDIVISPNSVLNIDADGDVKWVEVTGASIEAGKSALNDLEEKMGVMGLELRVMNEPSETATGRLLDAAESNSQLKAIAMDLEWAMFNALMYAGAYINIDASTSEYKVNTDYTVLKNEDLKLLVEMFKEGLLTAAQVLAEVKSRGLLLAAINQNVGAD